MTPEQENAFYADPDNQVPQGPPVRRKAKLSEPVPVRFPEELLQEVRDRAAADDARSPTGPTSGRARTGPRLTNHSTSCGGGTRDTGSSRSARSSLTGSITADLARIA